MENELVKSLVWAGLMAGIGSLASFVATRLATVIWKRIYGEEPPL